MFDGKGTKMNNDKQMLEAPDRVSALEDHVAKLDKALLHGQQDDIGSETNKKTAKPGRDTSKYRFNGEIYCKNRLVLAVVQKYAKESPNIAAGDLMSAFDKSLQGSLGVVRPLEGLKDKYADFERRFFTKPHEIIRTSTGDCVVCTQWGKSPKPNINAFLRRARQLKYEISEIKS